MPPLPVSTRVSSSLRRRSRVRLIAICACFGLVLFAVLLLLAAPFADDAATASLRKQKRRQVARDAHDRMTQALTGSPSPTFLDGWFNDEVFHQQELSKRLRLPRAVDVGPQRRAASHGGRPQKLTFDGTINGACYETDGYEAGSTTRDALPPSIDIVYTWVNGSDPAHVLRKLAVGLRSLLTMKRRRSGAINRRDEQLRLREELEEVAESVLRRHAQRSTPLAARARDVLASIRLLATNISATQLLDLVAPFVVNSRDRDSDELRFSLRSVERNVRFNAPCGRVVLVSPGHTPRWMDPAAVFFSGVSGITRGTCSGSRHGTDASIGALLDVVKLMMPHDDTGGFMESDQQSALRRIVGVHQDALIDEEARPTFNTNTIEFALFRIPRLSDLFVHFNDDYFVVQPTSASDFVNDRGGPVLRHEPNVIHGGDAAHVATTNRMMWLRSVFFTNAHLALELGPSMSGKELPVVDRMPFYNLTVRNRTVTRLLELAEKSLCNDSAIPSCRKDVVNQQQRRFFLKHAPFVYCRRLMAGFIWERFGHIIRQNGKSHRHRHERDLIPPLIHNSLMMRRPFLSDAGVTSTVFNAADAILNLEKTETEAAAQSSTRIAAACHQRDKERLVKRCGPALAKVGAASSSTLIILSDNVEENGHRLNELTASIMQFRAGVAGLGGAPVAPHFLALNDAFGETRVGNSVRDFMLQHFAKPSGFESVNHLPDWQRGAANLIPNGGSRSSFEKLLAVLMAQPIVIFVPSTPAACLILRSLEFALPHHTGRIGIVALEIDPKDAKGTPPRHVGEAASLEGCDFDGDITAKFVPVVYAEPDAVARLKRARQNPLALAAVAARLHESLFVDSGSDARGVPSVPIVIDFSAPYTAAGQSIGFADLEFVATDAEAKNGATFSIWALVCRGIATVSATSLDVLWDSFPLRSSRFERQ